MVKIAQKRKEVALKVRLERPSLLHVERHFRIWRYKQSNTNTSPSDKLNTSKKLGRKLDRKNVNLNKYEILVGTRVYTLRL